MRFDEIISRRGFVAGSLGAASALGFSLVVKADELASAAPRDAGAIREAMDRVSAPTVAERLAADPHMAVVELECDFCVAGGGMAGVCAALAAARHGARVVLIQDRSRLGGNASSEVRMHIVGADCSGGRPGWREGGILEELRLEYMARNPHQAWEMWDLMLYDKLVSEPGMTLLLDTAVCAADVQDEVIREVLARSDKTELVYRIKAPMYADCTGDCRLGLEAGAAYRTGHEGFNTFYETLAPALPGSDTLGSSLLFTARDHGMPVPFTPPYWARKVTKEHLKLRRVDSWEYGYWWIEWGGQRDAIQDNERIRFELLSIVMGVWDYIKNSGDHPDSATWAMNWIGMIPGKRASRRLEGPHILTQHDLTGMGEPFDDAVAIGGWPMDDHPPAGFDDPESKPAIQIQTPGVFNIPLRSLYSRNLKNLFMAGRNISASHVAFTSTRVMATCAVEGQAIGTAAAYCARQKLSAGDVVTQNERLREVQQILLRDDQTIRGLKNEDPADLARRARASASGSVDGSSPEHVIDGYVRDVPGQWEHRWGAPLRKEGAWLELAWDAPVALRQVQLTLDSGFQRPLTLTEQLNYRGRMVVGPQPETARDYVLSYRDAAGEWHELARVADNYQRLRRHMFEAVEAQALRLAITATNGSEEARVFEVRCYG
jgi:hypothetical protein